MKRNEWTSIVLVWILWLVWAFTFGCKIANTAKPPPLPPKPQVRALTTRTRPPIPYTPPRTNLYVLWEYPDSTTNLVFVVHRTNRPAAKSPYWHEDVVPPVKITFWHTNFAFNSNLWTWQTNVSAESNVYVFEITNGVADAMGFVWVTASNSATGLESQ